MGTGGSRDHELADGLAAKAAGGDGRYQDLFTAIPHGLIHYCADGSVIDANPAACEILGLDRAALSSWPVFPPGQAVHEDGSPFTLTELPMRAALRAGVEVSPVVVGIPARSAGQVCAAAESVLADAPARADDVCLLALHLPGRNPARA